MLIRCVARRYLRAFKFIESFNASYAAWQVPVSTGTDSIRKMVVVAKWSVLGVYYAMENLSLVCHSTIYLLFDENS